MSRGFYFQTKNNNSYFYNDIDGKVSLEDKNCENDFIYGEEKKIAIKFDKNNIENYLVENGFKQLTLIVTNNCNLRCKYCVYSGEYENQRIHNNKKMTFSTAKAAIDKYLEAYQNKKLNNIGSPFIGFYGGEPFLNFQLVKECVEYVNKKYPYKVRFLVTSNATIMNEKIAEFLVTYKIHMSFSLNGNAKENDRLRVYENGSGTYQDIVNNLNYLRNYDVDYFKSYTDIISCYDWKSNLYELQDFFKQNHSVLPNISRILQVSDTFTDWYSQFTEDDKVTFFEQKEGLFNEFKSKVLNNKPLEGIERTMFASEYLEIINRPINIRLEEYHPKFLPCTGTCVPASKIAVTPNGELHCCEKVNYARPLGNVETWVDYDEIILLINDFNEVMLPHCGICPVQRLCPICYTACLDGEGNITRKNIDDCKNVLKIIKERFEDIYSILEDGVLADDFITILKGEKKCINI